MKLTILLLFSGISFAWKPEMGNEESILKALSDIFKISDMSRFITESEPTHSDICIFFN